MDVSNRFGGNVGGRFEEARRTFARKRRNRILAVIAVFVIIVIVFSRSAPVQRAWKSFWSEMRGGIDRTVTVYDNTGNVLRVYEGKFDIQESDTRVFFDDENGRRITIYNAIVISEENMK